MASVKEVLLNEDSSLQTIVLHLEGIFYHAYNESCFLFHRFISQYDVKAKYCKKEQHMMYNIGFPESALTENLNKANQMKVEGFPKTIKIDATKIAGFLQLGATDYKEWTRQWSPDNGEPVLEHTSSLVQRLNSFDLPNATPMECMNFINQLQTEIRNGSSS